MPTSSRHHRAWKAVLSWILLHAVLVAGQAANLPRIAGGEMNVHTFSNFGKRFQPIHTRSQTSKALLPSVTEQLSDEKIVVPTLAPLQNPANTTEDPSFVPEIEVIPISAQPTATDSSESSHRGANPFPQPVPVPGVPQQNKGTRDQALLLSLLGGIGAVFIFGTLLVLHTRKGSLHNCEEKCTPEDSCATDDTACATNRRSWLFGKSGFRNWASLVEVRFHTMSTSISSFSTTVSRMVHQEKQIPPHIPDILKVRQLPLAFRMPDLLDPHSRAPRDEPDLSIEEHIIPTSPPRRCGSLDSARTALDASEELYAYVNDSINGTSQVIPVPIETGVEIVPSVMSRCYRMIHIDDRPIGKRGDTQLLPQGTSNLAYHTPTASHIPSPEPAVAFSGQSRLVTEQSSLIVPLLHDLDRNPCEDLASGSVAGHTLVRNFSTSNRTITSNFSSDRSLSRYLSIAQRSTSTRSTNSIPASVRTAGTDGSLSIFL
ncbi:hypothetical protein BC832DRAFT_547950 [Gaertneriomyces semiglobifer]|nr:hypothetical protein BC832DRAFT_547950 [Gaertneriomyces semiglobifer]